MGWLVPETGLAVETLVDGIRLSIQENPMVRSASIALLAAFIGNSLFASDLWLHVRIDERRGDRAAVTMNLPFTMIERIAMVVPHHRAGYGRIRFCSHDLTPADLREVLASLRAETGEPVILRVFGREPLRFTLQDTTLVVETRERWGDPVSVIVPLAVADALVASGDERVDLAAAARALAAARGGELILVDGSDATVRLWVDTHADGRVLGARR